MEFGMDTDEARQLEVGRRGKRGQALDKAKESGSHGFGV